MQRGFVIIAEDEKFAIRELVDKAMDKLPERAHKECDISRPEAEESTSVVLWHHLDDPLDFVLRDLSRTDVRHVADAAPWLDLTWDHGLRDHVIEEEVCHVH